MMKQFTEIADGLEGLSLGLFLLICNCGLWAMVGQMTGAAMV
jgi:hypothetical protein